MSGNLFEDMQADKGPRAGVGWFTAHCDGGSRGNPGPAGYGAVIEDPDGRVAARLSRFLGRQTNNYAEYAALLAVLEWALGNGVKRLRVVSDSELVVNQMKGRYKMASPGLKPLWEEAKKRAAGLERFEMSHTLRGGNKEADKLANAAMDEGSKGSGVSGASGVGGTGQAASRQGGQFAGPRDGASGKAAGAEQVLEGYVKDGVVHLLEGELPDGVFVKVMRK